MNSVSASPSSSFDLSFLQNFYEEAKTITNPYTQIRVLTFIATHLSETDQRKASAIFDQVIEKAGEDPLSLLYIGCHLSKVNKERGAVLLRKAKSINVESGNFKYKAMALEIALIDPKLSFFFAKKIKFSFIRDEVFTEIIKITAKINFPLALVIWEKISNTQFKFLALKFLAGTIDFSKLETLIEMTTRIKNFEQKISVQVELFRIFYTQNPRKWCEIFTDALKESKKLKTDTRDYVISLLAKAMMPFHPNESCLLLNQVESKSIKINALVCLAANEEIDPFKLALKIKEFQGNITSTQVNKIVKKVAKRFPELAFRFCTALYDLTMQQKGFETIAKFGATEETVRLLDRVYPREANEVYLAALIEKAVKEKDAVLSVQLIKNMYDRGILQQERFENAICQTVSLLASLNFFKPALELAKLNQSQWKREEAYLQMLKN